MPDLWSDLLACLDLHPLPSGRTGEERADDDATEFEGRNQQLDYHRVFGAQLLGQFLRIASATPFLTDRWLLREHSPLLAHGRSFGRGDMLAKDGTLVASYAQEALLRFSEAQ